MRVETASTQAGNTAGSQSTSSGRNARERDPDRATERTPRAKAQVIQLHGDGTQSRTEHPTRVAAAAADACGTTAPALRVSRPKQTQTTVPDCPGLVRITYPSGRATWFFDYRHPDTSLRTKARIGPANDKSAKRKSGRSKLVAQGQTVTALCTDDAVSKANAMRAALLGGITPLDFGITVERFVSSHYTEACRRVGKRTLADDLSRFRKHLLPLIGALVLVKVDRPKLVSALSRLTEAGMSAATRNRIAALLRAIYACAVELGFIESSPAARLSWLPESPPAPNSFKPDQLARLGIELTVASGVLQVFAGLAATTAMRSGEVQNLKWEDIDFEAGEILLPVTKSGRPQKVPLTPAVRAYLDVAAGWRRDGNPHVFPRPRARTPLPVPRAEWHEVLERASLPKQGFHVLRKTWATQAAYAGVPVITISRALRHASVSTTERHYLATRRDEQHAAAAQVGDLLRTAMGGAVIAPSSTA